MPKEFMLKDVTRFQALCAALPGFADAFQKCTQDQWTEGQALLPISVFGEKGAWRINIPRSKFIEIHHYDPERWNRWDEVDPPVGVPMRVEISAKEDFSFPTRVVARFTGREWFYDADEETEVDLPGKCLRFRPFIGPKEVQ